MLINLVTMYKGISLNKIVSNLSAGLDTFVQKHKPQVLYDGKKLPLKYY